MAAMSSRVVEHGTATVAWRPTPWDADGLGVAHTIELTALTGEGPDLAAALAIVDAEAIAAGAALSTTRVDESATAAIAALTAAGYVAIERSCALRFDLTAPPRPIARRTVAIEPARLADAAALADLAGDGFDYSRFHEDPRIHVSRARARYRRWIVDSLGNGDEVWLHRHHGALAALMSFRRAGDHVQLLLGGVRRDLGPLASMFWAGVLGRLRDDGVTTVDTRVSVANDGAMRLHEAFGFAVTSRAIGATRIYDPDALASERASRLPTTADRT